MTVENSGFSALRVNSVICSGNLLFHKPCHDRGLALTSPGTGICKAVRDIPLHCITAVPCVLHSTPDDCSRRRRESAHVDILHKLIRRKVVDSYEVFGLFDLLVSVQILFLLGIGNGFFCFLNLLGITESFKSTTFSL